MSIIGVYFEGEGPLAHPRFARAKKFGGGYLLRWPYRKASKKKQLEWAQDVKKHLHSWANVSNIQIIQIL